jgi:hypothetical protein
MAFGSDNCIPLSDTKSIVLVPKGLEPFDLTAATSVKVMHLICFPLMRPAMMILRA